MKSVLLSGFAVAGAVSLAVSATQCDLKSIKNTLLSNSTIKAKLDPAQIKCSEDSGIDMFAITEFPSKETALEIQQSDKGCNILINLINGYTNINTQCTIQINGTTVTYGRLISDFLDGKTGNETDSVSSSGSESESSSSASTFGNSGNSSSLPSTSGASTLSLSLVTYGVIAAITATTCYTSEYV
ncbi:Elicitin [Plasmopara halstedii]|uniref:Elicitin n=1 Tax=Plasmopara halstedii TaxID=4781 RepID=A0A0P1AN43_PLAHL|nr:Elicitin [Plasmopara halstedii]CEG42113.1 Elicitin [Plasmopara halstedii]|eukprot:XP_024578482.1 Elicitin [Plasmopara halstedii]